MTPKALLVRASRIALLGFLGGLGLTLLLPDLVLADNCDLRINPEDCANTAWTIGAVATCAAVAAVIAIVSASSQRLTGAQRREWQAAAATGAPPESCEPCTRYCRKVELGVAPGPLSVAYFALSAAGADATWTRERELRGGAVDMLDKAIVSYRQSPAQERLRPLAEPVATTLADDICAWLRSLPGRCEIEVGIHLSGSELGCGFTLYHCVRRGRSSVWQEEDSWESEVQAERDEPLATVTGLDPGVREPPSWLLEALTKGLIRVLEDQCS